MKHSYSLFAASAGLLALTISAPGAENFTDDFADGLDPRYWTVVGDTNLYALDNSMGDVRISKPVGGDYVFQSLGLTFRPTLRGDFDVGVDMTNASITRVDGVPGNQIQLNIRFGGQGFYVVRSDENPGGNNLHVFLDPPLVWAGTRASSATSGRLRVARTGTLVQGWFDGTMLFQGNYNTEDAVVNFALQNNGTRDATMVTFDNFSVTANELLSSRFTVDWFTVDGGGGFSAGDRFSVHGTIGQPDAGGLFGTRFAVQGGFWVLPVLVQTPGAPTLHITNAAPGWATIWWTPPTPGFTLQSTDSLAPTNWINAPSGTANPVTVPATQTAQFYRLHKP